MIKIEFPVMNVQMISLEKIFANNYNPNKVAPPEMRLLEMSIIEDGFTQPLVCYYDDKNDKYILIDGFHRYRVAKERLKLDKVPVTIIDKPLEQRMASTIRHNRARGVHGIKEMEYIVQKLVTSGWEDSKISEELGMEIEEVFRFKQSTGLKTAFSNHKFSKSWKAFEKKYYSKKKK